MNADHAYMSTEDPDEQCSRLRAWGKRLIPADAEQEIFSRCAIFDHHGNGSSVIVKSLDANAYELAIQCWNPKGESR